MTQQATNDRNRSRRRGLLRAAILWLGWLPAGTATAAIGPEISGAWLDPSRSGEGWVVEVLDDERAAVLWFTYPPAGSDLGEQVWLSGRGRIEGDSIVVDRPEITHGAIFGEDFDEDDVVREDWGTLTLTFDDCRSGRASYAGPPAFGSGELAMQRLTALAGRGCGDAKRIGTKRMGAQQVEVKGEALPGPGLSATWIAPGRNGEGWVLQVLDAERAALFWFSYDTQGRQLWLTGVGRIVDDRRIVFERMERATGAAFGADFDPAAIQRRNWGKLTLRFDACARGAVTFRAEVAGFGADSYPLSRLTRPAGRECALASPAPLVDGTWRQAARLPEPRGGHAAVALDGRLYVVGGDRPRRIEPLGEDRPGRRDPERMDDLLRYDPETDRWTRLTDMPGPRMFPAAVAFDGAIYVFSGRERGAREPFLSDGRDNVWRYRPETGQWQTLAPIPVPMVEPVAAVAGGYIYVVDRGLTAPRPRRLDPATGDWEVVDGLIFQSQKVDVAMVRHRHELWLLGGTRQLQILDETRIYDPLTDTVRAGRAMNATRRQIGAAVVGEQLLAIAGETGVNHNYAMRDSVEVLAPGAGQWRNAPAIPVPVRGSAVAAIDGAVYVVGGMTDTEDATVYRDTVQVYSPAPAAPRRR